MPPLLSSTTEGVAVYKRRWFILASAALLNATNAMTWNSFSTVAGLTHLFYDITFADVNWLATIFFIIAIPAGFASMWCIDHVGIRVSLNMAAGFNAFGALLRILSAVAVMPDKARYAVLMIGQCIAAFAQPFAMSAPAKIAQHWFPERQRTLATALIAQANPCGVLLSSIISPLIAWKPSDISTMLMVYGILPSITLLAMLLSLTRSKPEIPPSLSANVENEPYLTEMMQLVKNKMYLILAVSCGLGLALLTAVTTLSAQILCPKGYDDVYTGIVMALMVGCGLIASLITGIIADKTGHLQEIVKVFFLLASFFAALFPALLAGPYNPVGLGFVLCLMGIFSFGQFPILIELLVESSYPIGEASSTGLMVVISYAGSIILIVGLQAMGTSTSDVHGTCNADTLQGGRTIDYANGTIFIAVVMFLLTMAVVIFFNSPYHRRREEIRKKLEISQRLSNDESMHDTSIASSASSTTPIIRR